MIVPITNLAFLVPYRYLTVVPNILITIRHITNVLVYSNSRLLVCCRAHFALLIALLVVVGDMVMMVVFVCKKRG